MRHVEWRLPSKQRGKRQAPIALKVDPAFRAALREYAAQESARTGRQISQSTIITTLCLAADQRLRTLHQQIARSQTPN